MKRLIFVFAILAAPAVFAQQSIEERLARLEQEMRELRAENAELRKQLATPAVAATPAPAAAPKAAAAQEVRPAGKESKLVIGGFIQAQAEAGDRVDSRFGDENDRVFLRRARLNMQGSFPEHFDFKAEMDLAGTLGSSSGVRAQATDVYVQWTRYPLATLRAGQFKTPYGHEQLYSDTRLLAIERTLATDRIAIGRGVGVQLAGQRGIVSYAIGAFNGSGTNLSFNDDEGFMTVARATLQPWKRGDRDAWRIGVNGYRSEDRSAPVAPELGFAGNAFAGSRDAWGVDTQLIAGRLEVWAEILRSQFEPAAGADRELNGWSAAAAWQLTKQWQAVAMIDQLDAPLADVRTWTLGATYFVKGYDVRLQLNVLHTNADDTRVLARVQTLF